MTQGVTNPGSIARSDGYEGLPLARVAGETAFVTAYAGQARSTNSPQGVQYRGVLRISSVNVANRTFMWVGRSRRRGAA